VTLGLSIHQLPLEFDPGVGKKPFLVVDSDAQDSGTETTPNRPSSPALLNRWPNTIA